MTNYEYIKNLPLEQLARCLVQPTIIVDDDENFDGEFEPMYIDGWLSPNGMEEWDLESAIEDAII